MKLYLSKVEDMQSSFKKFYITKIPREENEEVDFLAQIASAANDDMEETKEFIQTLTYPSISEALSVSKFGIVPE